MDKLLPNFDVKEFTKHELEQLQKVFQKQQEFEHEMQTSLRSPRRSPISPISPPPPIEFQSKLEPNRSMKSLAEALKPPPIIAQLSKSSDYLPSPQNQSNDDQTSSSTSRLDPFFSKIVSLKEAVNKNLSFSSSTSSSGWKAPEVPTIPTPGFFKRFSSPQPPTERSNTISTKIEPTPEGESSSKSSNPSQSNKSKKTSLQEPLPSSTTSTTTTSLTSRIERFKLDYTSSKQTVRSSVATTATTATTRVDSIVKYSNNHEKEISFTKFELSSSSASSSPSAHLLKKEKKEPAPQEQSEIQVKNKSESPIKMNSPRKMPSPTINNSTTPNTNTNTVKQDMKSNDNMLSENSPSLLTRNNNSQASFKKQLPKLPERKPEEIVKVIETKKPTTTTTATTTTTKNTKPDTKKTTDTVIKNTVRKESKSSISSNSSTTSTSNNPITLGGGMSIGVGVGSSSKFDFSRSYPVQTQQGGKTSQQAKNWRRLRTKLTSVVWLSNPSRKRTCGKEPQLETIKDDDLLPPTTTNSSQDSPDHLNAAASESTRPFNLYSVPNYYGASRITNISSNISSRDSSRRKDNNSNQQVFHNKHHQPFDDDVREKSGDSAIVCDSSHFIYPISLEFNENNMSKPDISNRGENSIDSSSSLRKVQYRTKRAKSMLEDSAFSSREDNESVRRSIIRLKSISDESDLIKVKNQAAASMNSSTDTENPSPVLMDFAALILHEHKRAIETSKTGVNDQDSSISYTQTTSSRRGSTLSSRQESSMSVGESEVNKQSPQQQREHVLVSKYSIDMRRANLKNSEGWYNRRKELRKSKKWSDNASPDANAAANASLYYDIANGNEVIIDQEISCTSSSNPPSNGSDSFGSKASPSASPKLRNQLPQTPVETTKPARKLPMIPNSPEHHSKRDSEKIKPLEYDKTELKTSVSSHNNNEEHQQQQHEQQQPTSGGGSGSGGDLSKALSKSIDSLESIKSRKSIKEIKERAPNYAKSVDLTAVANMEQKSNFKLIHGSIISAQRSIDYPYIKRKNPPLSEIVRKRLLFKKLSHDLANSGDSFSNSVEKEHVPKTVRRIIIRQDNSIEIAITRPPRLRRQTFSEDVVAPINTDGSVSGPASANAMRNMQTLSVSPNGGTNDRRKTIETCENIFLQSEESTKLRARTPPSNPHRILLYKDKSDKSIRKNGLGMTLSGGLECEDGSLGCFVTLVNKGGPADLNGIEVGDQILEFNGNSLIESTYEEVRNLQNLSGDYVQLVVHHNNVRYKHGSACSPLEISRHFETVPRLCPTETRKRRNLPPLPFGVETQMQINRSKGKQQREATTDLSDYIVAEKIAVPCTSNLLKPILKTQGRLQMQIWNNCKELKLALTVNQASNLQLRAENEQSYILVVGRLTFEEQPTKTFRTNPVPAGLKPVWNETFLFDYNESVDEATLEICAHETKSPNDLRLLRETFLGMVILPLSEANLEDEPRWYELRDKPTRKASTVSVTFKSSSNDSQESLCETKKPKKSSLRKASLSEEIGVENVRRRSSLSNAPIIKPVRKFSQALARLLTFRRNSESAIKKNIINTSDSASGDELFMDDQSRSALFRSKRSNQRRNTENVVNLNFSIPKTILRNSTHSSLLSPNQNEIESDIDSYFSTEITTLNTTTSASPSPSSNPSVRKSSNAGITKPSSHSSSPANEQIIGVIKLGFLMSKGQLEITIFEARLFIQKPLDTCVKTYLVAGRHKMLKKKSKLVKHTNKPVYNSKCTYNACNVLDRRIQVVMVSKQRQKSSKDEFIGEVLIHLAQLDLTHQTIAWYKLHPKSENSPNSDHNDSP